MQKKLLSSLEQPAVQPEGLLAVEELADVELTSEDVEFPLEHAFRASGEGWRADTAGPQTIRLHFHEPVSLVRIVLEFRELRYTRTQEFVLRWRGESSAWREVLRQQWNFSASGSNTEREEVKVALPAVSELELTIVPDISGGAAVASLRYWALYST